MHLLPEPQKHETKGTELKGNVDTSNKCGEGVKKREPSYTVGGNAKCCSHYGEKHGSSLKKLKTELLYDPTVPLLGLYLEKTPI